MSEGNLAVIVHVTSHIKMFWIKKKHDKLMKFNIMSKIKPTVPNLYDLCHLTSHHIRQASEL